MSSTFMEVPVGALSCLSEGRDDQLLARIELSLWLRRLGWPEHSLRCVVAQLRSELCDLAGINLACEPTPLVLYQEHAEPEMTLSFLAELVARLSRHCGMKGEELLASATSRLERSSLELAFA